MKLFNVTSESYVNMQSMDATFEMETELAEFMQHIDSMAAVGLLPSDEQLQLKTQFEGVKSNLMASRQENSLAAAVQSITDEGCNDANFSALQLAYKSWTSKIVSERIQECSDNSLPYFFERVEATLDQEWNSPEEKAKVQASQTEFWNSIRQCVQMSTFEKVHKFELTSVVEASELVVKGRTYINEAGDVKDLQIPEDPVKRNRLVAKFDKELRVVQEITAKEKFLEGAKAHIPVIDSCIVPRVEAMRKELQTNYDSFGEKWYNTVEANLAASADKLGKIAGGHPEKEGSRWYEFLEEKLGRKATFEELEQIIGTTLLESDGDAITEAIQELEQRDPKDKKVKASPPRSQDAFHICV